MSLGQQLPRRRTLPSVALRLARAAGPLGRWLIRLNRDLFLCDYVDRWQRSFTQNRWLGLQVEQLPFDLLLYQEIVFSTKPTLIVQTGVNYGGSAAFFASLLDIIGADEHSRYVGIDIKLSDEARSIHHPRVSLIEGDSADPAIVAQIRRLSEGHSVMVVLDSDHSARHVHRELEALAALVSPGCFLVVEDTHLNGHPSGPDGTPGPMEGLQAYLGANPSAEGHWALWREPILRNGITYHTWLCRKPEC